MLKKRAPFYKILTPTIYESHVSDLYPSFEVRKLLLAEMV